MKTTATFIVLGVLIVAAVFMASAWLLQALVNVPLAHYDIKTLDYGSALAINALIWVFVGGSNAKSNNKD